MNNINDTKPTVSVVMITYNHEAFIAEAIEGVLMQDADFPIEFIIADDCSPDRTNEIVQNYISNHPNGKWITYTRHPNNKGMMPNFIWALEQAKGKYIALCEGDDYWTDPLKLQKQVDFLEGNEDVILHCTNSKKFDEELKVFTGNSITSDSMFFGIDTILQPDNIVVTATAMFKNNIIKDWEKINIDLALWVELLHVSNKKGFYLNEVTSTYRLHNEGIMSKIGSINSLTKIISIHKNFLKNYRNYREITKSTIRSLNTKLLKELVYQSKKKQALFFYVRNIRNIELSLRDVVYLIRKS